MRLTERIKKRRANSWAALGDGRRRKAREGTVGAFAFGHSRGIIEGVLAAVGVPVTSTTAFDRSSSRWLGISDLIAELDEEPTYRWGGRLSDP